MSGTVPLSLVAFLWPSYGQVDVITCMSLNSTQPDGLRSTVSVCFLWMGCAFTFRSTHPLTHLFPCICKISLRHFSSSLPGLCQPHPLLDPPPPLPNPSPIPCGKAALLSQRLTLLLMSHFNVPAILKTVTFRVSETSAKFYLNFRRQTSEDGDRR